MKKVIIIGGGVAGFTAGTYLKANGYDTLILEKNAVAGGACIGWERSGCYIDGCIHWFTGVKKDTDLYKLWKDVGALDDYWVDKMSKLSCKDYAKRFKNKYLQTLISDFMAPHYNFMSMLYMLGHISANDGGIPKGGSLEVVRRMEEKYLEMGGTVRKATSVEKVIIKDGKAVGVLLKNGEELYCDWVVCTTPIEHCLADLLEGKYADKKFDERIQNQKDYPIYTFTTAVIKCPMRVENKQLSEKILLDKPIVIDREYNQVAYRNYSYDTSVKGGKDYCVIQATIHSDDEMYFWWKNHKNNGTYKQEKQRVADELLAIAKEIYPDVADEMEIIDVVTPCTYERYLNSRHGAFQGFVHTKRGKSLMHNGRIKGLKNFIVAGQYIIQSGGLPPAVMSGRFACLRICHDDKKKFVDISKK